MFRVFMEYFVKFQTLVSYRCTKNRSDDILSFDSKIVMERSICKPRDHCSNVLGTVGKIGDDLICMVKSVFPLDTADIGPQPVHVMIFRVLEVEGRCSRLKSFDLTLPEDDLFHSEMLFSCFVLHPEVVSNEKEHGERTLKEDSLSYKDVLLQGCR